MFQLGMAKRCKQFRCNANDPHTVTPSCPADLRNSMQPKALLRRLTSTKTKKKPPIDDAIDRFSDYEECLPVVREMTLEGIARCGVRFGLH